MKTLIVTLQAIFLIFMSTNSYAKFKCNGPVDRVVISGNGGVMLSVGSTPIHSICNLSSKGAYTIDTASCKAIYEIILTAKRDGESITVYYDYYDKTSLSCESIPAGSGMAAAYGVGF